MNKDEFVKHYNEIEYRTLEIPINPDDPKALKRKGWDQEPSNKNIGKNNLYAVVQEGVKLVFDIDDVKFNDVLDDFRHKTLVVKTANDGIHYYFMDIPRVEKYRIKTSKLYHEGKIIGDIKAHMSYVIGAGSSYYDKKDGKTKSYTQISSCDTILKMDCYVILEMLKENGITTEKSLIVEKVEESKYDLDELMNGKFERGTRRVKLRSLYIKLRNKGKTPEQAELQVRRVNATCIPPITDDELDHNIPSAEKFFLELENDYKSKNKFTDLDRIDKAADELQKHDYFLTVMQENKILLFNGKIYDDLQAEPMIKEKVENLIPLCSTKDRQEVINKIKARTYIDITKFDADPNLRVLDNGILHWDTLEVTSHTPDNLSRILLPVEFHKPKYEIRDDHIFEDIERNLKETLFYKSMEASFTVKDDFGKESFQRESFQTALEVAASFLVLHGIDERHYMFLGTGDNGKGVFFYFMELMIGKDNISNVPLQSLASDRFLLAEIDGKLGNLFTDLEPDELKHTGKIKGVGSNEPITVQKKYGQPYVMRPFTKLMFSCNRFPKVYDQSEGFFRRWIIVLWKRSFEGDAIKDENLKEKLAERKDEVNKIFSSLVYLAKYVEGNGKFTHTKTWKEIQKEWNENADPIDYFISNYIVDSDTNKTKRETYDFYKKIMFDKGEPPLGFGQFGKAFAEYYEDTMLNDHTTGNRTKWVWLNIAFKEPKQASLEDSLD